MPAPTFRRPALAALFLAAAGLVGCSDGRPKTAPVKGTVTYAGKPVDKGSISFIPDGLPVATGELGPGGAYTLTTFKKGDGAVLGRHKVVITAFQESADPVEASAKLPPPLIPLKYMNLMTSGLTAEVKDGDNTIDFALPEEPTKQR